MSIVITGHGVVQIYAKYQVYFKAICYLVVCHLEDSLRGGEHILEDVLVRSIRTVINKVLKRSSASCSSLDIESKHGNHSETTVLDLLHLELSKLLFSLSKLKRVKVFSSRVSLIERYSVEFTGATVCFSTSHKKNLCSSDSNDGLSMDKLRRTEVVDALIVQNKSSSLEPNWFFKLNPVVVGKDLREDASKSTKHSPASVENLSLAIVCESSRVSRKAKSIPSVVSRVLSGEIIRNTGQEGIRKPLWSVWAVPLNIAGIQKSFVAILLSKLAYDVLSEIAVFRDRTNTGLSSKLTNFLKSLEASWILSSNCNESLFEKCFNDEIDLT